MAADLGSSQKGIVTRAQLVATGLSPGQIKRAVRGGALHRRYRGVYSVGHLAWPPHGRELAALLACGEGAVLSHWSAAYLWGLTEAPPDEVHVSLSTRRCRPKAGVRLHRAFRLAQADVSQRHGICLTSPARTLVDLAGGASMDDLERLIAEAKAKKLLKRGALEAAAARAGRRRGTAAVRAYLRREGAPVLTRSGKERRLRCLLRQAGLPQPVSNARVAGYEVDFLWPEERVVVEVDSYGFHGHRRAFERDRRKSMRLADAGFTVIRVSTGQLEHEPLAVIAHIARTLDRATRAHG